MNNKQKQSEEIFDGLVKNNGTIGIDQFGRIVVTDIYQFEGELIIQSLVKYKEMFDFSCLIMDIRARKLFDDCGFGGKTLYINLRDNDERSVDKVNGIYFFKENNYCLKFEYGKLSWIDLWKAIDELVKLNGNTDHYIIESFEVKESANGRSYVKPVLCVFDEY